MSCFKILVDPVKFCTETTKASGKSLSVAIFSRGYIRKGGYLRQN